MSTDSTKRKMAAILSADVKGYSRLMSADEEGTVKSLNNCREIISRCVQGHSGRVVDSPGDNVLAEFVSTVEAVKCALKIQENLKIKNACLPESRRMEFRIGVNLGDVIEEEGRIYGDGVNIAARLEGLAEGGGICLSGTAFDQVKNKLAVGYQYLGKQTVKNIPDPVRAYKVLMEPESAGKVIGEKEPKQGSRAWKAIAAVAVLVLVAGGLVWNFYGRPPKIEPASKEKMAYPLPDKPSIAVLPFDNMSGDPKEDYFSDGLTEQIITSLSKVQRLFVIARNSTFVYKRKPVKIQQVAEDLGVRYVLEGSVQKSGERLRITAQLIDAITGYHIWSEHYDREVKDVFAIQDSITLEILKALDVKISRGEKLGKSTDNLEAYFKLLQAGNLLYQFNKESNAQARELTEEAIALDPNFAGAYYGLAGITMMDVWLGISKSPKDSRLKAIELCQKAISLDDTLAGAFGFLGYLYVQIGEYEKGIEIGERAIEIAPSSADAHSMLAQALNFSGRAPEALALNEKAFRLNPVGATTYYYTHASFSYILAGRYEDAVRITRQELSRTPNNILAYARLVWALSASGRDEEAKAAAQSVLRIDPKFSAKRLTSSLSFKDPAVAPSYLEHMLKAGLPE
jgi:adenylate cyclase